MLTSGAVRVRSSPEGMEHGLRISDGPGLPLVPDHDGPEHRIGTASPRPRQSRRILSGLSRLALSRRRLLHASA